MKKKELEKICFNCNSFFPASIEPTEFGICFNNKEFEPFIDELLENANYSCCQDLINRKKFLGEKQACPDFSPAEIIDEDTELGRELMFFEGQLNKKKFEELLIKEQIRNIDWKTVPVNCYVKQLKSPKPEERDSAISSLSALIVFGNKAAFQELFNFFRQLPPPNTQEVHFKENLLHNLQFTKHKTVLTRVLLKELYNTPSNNTTRQWISDILRYLEYCPPEKIRKPLEKMLNDKRFSYRLKQKIERILSMV